MSNLSDFLAQHGIQPDALARASRAVERHKNADRTLAVRRATARREKKSYEELNLEKPKGLGRGFSIGTLQRALKGEPVPRLTRRKIVRAVNDQLVSAKKEPVEWRALFADVPAKKKAKKK